VSLDTAKPDVLTIALFVAAALHAVVILGVSFEPFLNELRTPPSLEVVLVQKTDSERPDEADYLADSSQDGGGESDKAARPASPFTSNQDLDTDGIAPIPMEKSAPKPSDASDDAVLTSLFSDRQVTSETEEKDPSENAELQAEIEIDQSFEIARLQAEGKVERMGNLNYPDQVRRNKLAGAVVVTVGIFKNGAIESVIIEESSGQQLLDDAAKRIVRLASPFEPLVGKLGDETDILYITRTWDFQSSNSVISY